MQQVSLLKSYAENAEFLLLFVYSDVELCFFSLLKIAVWCWIGMLGCVRMKITFLFHLRQWIEKQATARIVQKALEMAETLLQNISYVLCMKIAWNNFLKLHFDPLASN